MFRRRTSRGSGPPEGRSIFHELRDQVLDLDPSAVGLAPAAARPDVWAGVMDMGYPDQRWATLVVVGDGTVSLYTSSGGGTIGAGEHRSVAVAADHWLAGLQAGLSLLPVTAPTDLPGPQRVTLRALTFDGPRSVEAAADDLGYERHPASALFHAAHEVLTQIRLIEESGTGR
jgi:hypothetical protein